MIKHTFAKKGVDNYEVFISTVEGDHFEGECNIDICEKYFHMDVYSNNIFAAKDLKRLSNILKNINKVYENMRRDNLINQETTEAMFSWGYNMVKSVIVNCKTDGLTLNVINF